MARTLTATQSPTNAISLASLNLVGGDGDDIPQWMNELQTRGWTVIPETVPRDKALAYANRCYDWLEGWGLGYNRDDPTTRKAAKLPFTHRAGIFNRYGVAHEQFMWDLRSEPALVEKFEQIWGTKELMVSFDAVNLSVPEAEREPTDPIFLPWSHVDQSPLRTNLQCVQGILNFLPNGPQDGGTMVLSGSSALYSELWQHFDHKKGEDGWNTWEQQFLDEEMCDWLVSKGCKWVKICAQPGDLILWDSRTVHYGAAPSSTNDRFAAYVCYKPASHVSEQTKQERLEAFARKDGTAHDPSILRLTPRLPPEDHPTYEDAAKKPFQEPVLSQRARQMIGLEPY